MNKSNDEFFDAIMILFAVEIAMATAWAYVATRWDKRKRDRSAPAAPKAPERDGLAGSGAVFCDPTTLSESQLRDTIGACLEHLNRRFPPKAPERGAP